MIPRAEWESVTPEPPRDPADPARRHVAYRDAHVCRDAPMRCSRSRRGGAKYGAGAAATLPVGGWQGWTYRARDQVPVDPVDEGPSASRAAKLKVRTTTQVRVGFGSNPKMEVRRITENLVRGQLELAELGKCRRVARAVDDDSSGAVVHQMPGGAE